MLVFLFQLQIRKFTNENSTNYDGHLFYYFRNIWSTSGLRLDPGTDRRGGQHPPDHHHRRCRSHHPSHSSHDLDLLLH